MPISAVGEIAKDVGLLTGWVLLAAIVEALLGTTGGTAGTTPFPDPSLPWLPTLAVRFMLRGNPRLGGLVKEEKVGCFSSLLLLAMLAVSSSVRTDVLLPDGLALRIDDRNPVLLRPLESVEIVLAILSLLCPNVNESALFLFGEKQLLGGADM